MVGFDPRAMIVPPAQHQHEPTLWRYALTGETLRVNGYGVVLTIAAVVHRDICTRILLLHSSPNTSTR